MCDTAMADADQVLGQLPGARDAVADHEIAVDVGQRAVEEHDREAAAQTAEAARSASDRWQAQGAGRRRGGRPGRRCIPARGADRLRCCRGAPGSRPCAPSSRRRARPARRRVDDVGDDQADRARLLRDQPARDTVWNVVEVEYRALDATLRLGIDGGAAAQNARHRHRRDAGALRNIPQGNGHRSSILIRNMTSRYVSVI